MHYFGLSFRLASLLFAGFAAGSGSGVAASSLRSCARNSGVILGCNVSSATERRMLAAGSP
jgi:hypothetical protein